MGDPLWVDGDGTLRDPASCFVVPLHIVHDLVGVDVAVVVGDGDRVWMEVERTRTERADHKIVSLEGLVDRWRHVEHACDWGEVVDVEAVGVVAPVPTNHFEWVVWVDVGVHSVACFDSDFELALLVVCEWVVFVFKRDAEVTLAIRRVLEELRGFLRDVSRRGHDVAGVAGLERDELPEGHFCLRVTTEVVVVRAVVWSVVEDHFVDHAFGHDDVVFGAELECSEHGGEGARPEVDEDALVALPVLEVVVHLLVGLADGHFDIAVPEEDYAAFDGITAAFGFLGHHMVHAHRVDVHILLFGGVQRFPSGDLGRWMDVVHDAAGSDEAFGAEEFFGVEGAVWTTELGVAFLWELPHRHVIRHRKSTSFFPSGVLLTSPGGRCHGISAGVLCDPDRRDSHQLLR